MMMTFRAPFSRPPLESSCNEKYKIQEICINLLDKEDVNDYESISFSWEESDLIELGITQASSQEANYPWGVF